MERAEDILSEASIIKERRILERFFDEFGKDSGLAVYGFKEVTEALKSGKNGVMVAFQPPKIEYLPLAEAINKVRTVPTDNEFIQIAKSLGIFLGVEL